MRWRHVKRNTTYTELHRGTMNSADPAWDRKSVVVYQSDQTGAVEVRMAHEFDDGRFVREND